MLCKYNVEQWCEDNKEMFHPPICNRLMHQIQLSVMYVGGPNVRRDFHLDEGSEFFWMIKGNLELHTIQAGKLKIVHVKEGEVFLVPSRIPHSPRRPANTLGLVIERNREKDLEMDGLRWYTDDNCDKILWEKYFYCDDLSRDLPPIVKEYEVSEEFRTKVPGNNISKNPPLKQVQKLFHVSIG